MQPLPPEIERRDRGRQCGAFRTSRASRVAPYFGKPPETRGKPRPRLLPVEISQTAWRWGESGANRSSYPATMQDLFRTNREALEALHALTVALGGQSGLKVQPTADGITWERGGRGLFRGTDRAAGSVGVTGRGHGTS